MLLIVCHCGYAGEPFSEVYLPDLALIDAHSHIYRGEEDFLDLLMFMDRNSVTSMQISGLTWGNADKLVLAAARRYPDRFVPYLRGFDPERESSITYVRNQLMGGEFKGIGEIFVNGHGVRLQGDNPVLTGIYLLAAQYQVPVLLHWTFGSNNPREPGTQEAWQQLKKILKEHPATPFILAHCGKGPAPEKPEFFEMLSFLLTRNSNLYVDLSGLQEELFDQQEQVTALGKSLLEIMRKFPESFLLGFDLGDPGSLPTTSKASARKFRKFLSFLQLDAAKKIARENSLHLYARSRLPSPNARGFTPSWRYVPSRSLSVR